MIKKDTQGVTFAKGFTAAGVKAGIKKSGNLDVAVIYTKTQAVVAGTFTQNKVAAAPVYVSKEVVATGTAHAIVANAGCANACTGQQGLDDAHKMAQIAADELGVNADDVIVGSTGVIGVNLPMDKLEAGIKDAVANLSADGSGNAGRAIITTDTHSKSVTCEFELSGKTVRMGAIAKGSGMIRPNMATMLCYITTDIAIDQALLQKAVSGCVEKSFNMISVDGDMSTTDYMFVDNAAMKMIQEPAFFDVMVTENTFGDILTDEGSVISGSMGLLPSASTGESTPVFEPIHGSWPQAKGLNIANPLAQILSVAMLFEYFDLKEEGALIRKAVDASLDENVRTPEIQVADGAKYGTKEVGQWIVDYIKKA